MRPKVLPGVAALLLAGTASVPFAAPTAAHPVVERHSPRTGAPSLGPGKASNTLVFFTDYQCPVCPRAARELDQLVADFNGDLRVEVRHNPLVTIHPNAFDAATAAKAAQRQGKFWEYHAALLGAGALDRATLFRLAKEIGLDAAVFAKDFEDAGVRGEVSADVKAAADAKARGTPAFLINGYLETGWGSLPGLEHAIRAHWK